MIIDLPFAYNAAKIIPDLICAEGIIIFISFFFNSLPYIFNGKQPLLESIFAFINFNGLTQHVVVKNPSSHVYSGDEVELLLNLAEGGRSIDEISDQLGRSVRSVSSKCSHLLRTGELSKRPHRRGEEQSDTEMGRVK